MTSYKQVKRGVLVMILGTLCFGFGYLYFGAKLATWLSGSTPAPANSVSGPPPMVMRELQELRKRIAENPKDEAAYTELGNLYFQANKFDQALTYYEKAVELDGKDIIARNDLALCYHIAKREKEAFQQLETAIQISPRAQHLWLTLGLVSFESGQIKRAGKALKKAVLLDPASQVGKEAKSMLSSLPKAPKGDGPH